MDDIYERHGLSRDRLGDAFASSDVFDRQFGAELTAWEMQLQRDFHHRMSGRRFRHRGFVHYTRDSSLILLTPSPWILEGAFIQFKDDQSLPPEGSFVEVEGRSIAVPRVLARKQETVRAFTADSVSIEQMEFLDDIRPPLSLKEISELLFEHVGMAEASKRVFAQLYVSSPPFQESIGGLTAGIQAIASKQQVNRLLRFMKRVLPPSFRSSGSRNRNVSGIKVYAPRSWRLDVGRIGKSKLRKLCLDRVDPAGFREVSVSTLTGAKTAVLPDVPIALATEDFWVETHDPSHLQLPILKSAITFQLQTPAIGSRSIDAATKHVLGKIDSLKDSFGLSDKSLGRGHILDADALGRPLSTIKLARSSARSKWKSKVNAGDIKKAWDRVLEPALKEFLELTELKAEVEEEWGADSKYHKFNTRVLRALRKLDDGTTRSLGPTLQEIAQEADVPTHITAKTLEEMKLASVVYEPRTGHYRLV
ncbi:MAG: hypothetical protein BAJATHORv1_120044 [Candidatus Thorarchaeota archaeon]|nr:MAG: hypothetical protein BAJATHORv1_120044 [Candidatus Thorarchaeota archaeon]